MKILILITSSLLYLSSSVYADEIPTQLVNNINCGVSLGNEYFYFLPGASTEKENTSSVTLKGKYLVEASFLKKDSDSVAVFNVKKIDAKKNSFISLFKVSRSFKQEDVVNKNGNFLTIEMPEVKDLGYQDLKVDCWLSTSIVQ